MKMRSCMLGDIITFQRGHDLPRDKMNHGIYPVIGSNGVIGSHNEYTTESPCITVGRSGNVGTPFLSKTQSWAHNTTLYIKKYNNVDPIFVFYYLKTLQLNSYAGGSAVPTLNRNHIHSLPVMIPDDIAIQERIGKTLAEIDDKIELNTAINQNLEAQAKAIFKSWFIDFEPFRNGEFIDSELGRIPKGWRVGVLSELGTIVGGSTPSKQVATYYSAPEKGIAWITPKDLSLNKNKFISHGEMDITQSGFDNSSTAILPRGSVLFSSRAPIGYMAIAKNNLTTNQGFKSIIPHPAVGTAYVYYGLKSLLPIIEGMASGSTFKEISGSGMKSVPALIPPREMLNDFEKICAPLFAKQEQNEYIISSLDNLRDTLLPKLMSGEIDVSEVAI